MPRLQRLREEEGGSFYYKDIAPNGAKTFNSALLISLHITATVFLKML